MDIFNSIGVRLREERERAGLSQTDVAEIAADAGVTGATRQSQSLYEKGKRMPDAAYLAAIAAIGADVRYIVTGEREGPPPLKPDEQTLLDGYRALDTATKRRMLAFVLGSDALTAPAKKQINVIAPGGQAAGRDMTINNKNGGRKE